MLQTKTRKLTCLRLRGVIIRESATESDSLVALSGIYAAKCAFGGTFYRAADGRVIPDSMYVKLRKKTEKYF